MDFSNNSCSMFVFVAVFGVFIAPVTTGGVYDGCTVHKGCYGEPDGCLSSENCAILLTYQVLNSSMRFTVTGSSDGYVACGLSHYGSMGSASIVFCKKSAGKVGIEGAWTLQTNGIKLLPNMTTNGDLNPVAASDNGNILTCTFDRKVRTTVEGSDFDVKRDLYLLVAKGLLDATGYPQYHDANRWVTSKPVNMSDYLNIAVGFGRSIYVSLHGTFMAICWLWLCSTAIITARYYKLVFDSSTLLNAQDWFNIHRGMMISALCIAITGLSLIFTYNNGWQTVVNNPHPILGITASALMAFQIVMSFVRCKPNHNRRWMFNYLHRFIGTSAYIVACVTIAYASNLAKARLKAGFIYSFIASVTFQVFSYITLQILALVLKLRPDDKTAKDDCERKNYTPNLKMFRMVYLIYMLINTATTSALIYFFWL